MALLGRGFPVAPVIPEAVVAAAGGTATPGTVSFTWGIGTPTETATGTPTPSAVPFTWGVGAPSVLTGTIAAPSTVPFVWGIGSPTKIASGTPTPTTVPFAWTIGAPTAGSTTYVLNDDFPGSTIDTGQWVVYDRLGDGLDVGNEVNAVAPSQVTVSSGTVRILVEHRTVTASDTTTSAPNPRSVDYVSGQIAQHAPSFLYGEVRVRAKFPGGIGLWPCIWMLGDLWKASQPFTANVAGASWPNGGWWELDIAEFIGNHRSAVNNALHLTTANRGGSGEKALPFDATTRFMVYRLIWTPTSLTWMVDAEDGVGWRTTLTMTGTAGTDIPNTPGYLIIHCAVGGVGGGTPDSATFPQTFEVDYAQVIVTSDTVIDTTPTPSAVPFTWGVGAPVVSVKTLPSTVPFTWSVATPVEKITTLPATVPFTWGVGAPTETASGTTTPSTVPFMWTLPATTVLTGTNPSPSPVAFTWSIPAPAEIASATPVPATVPFVWTLPAPTATATGTSSPTSVAYTWAVGAPTITASATTTTTSVPFVWAVPAPTILNAGGPTPSAVPFTWTLPTLTLTTSSLSAPGTVPFRWAIPAIAITGAPTKHPARATYTWQLPTLALEWALPDVTIEWSS